MAIVTISRGTFTGGKALAERLAERLGYPCLGREEIVPQAVERYGLTEKDLTDAMNEAPSFWQRLPGRRISYLKCFTSVLLEHVESGNLVYHGHVGHLALGEISHVMRVRVIADAEYRIAATMKRKNLTRDEAVAFVTRIDQQRERWTRFLYGVAWQDASLYDVLFNLSRVSVEGACETIIRMTELPDFQPTPQSVAALEDLTLASRVWAALAAHEETRSAQVTVTSHAGCVTIAGGAGSQKVIRAISAVARKVAGVQEIRSEVGVGRDWYW
ncbi:MAG: BON domain-containing protein [Deltaproteobacteria bacterium]|nr:BON domain-containing protein [Deltaproteobacteria bacterium]